MQDYPHHYKVVAVSATDENVKLGSEGLCEISSAPPKEFGGVGDKWSPETLLVAAVAGCFVLSYKAIASASKLSWVSLKCEVEGTLERNEGVSKFTSFLVHATLKVPDVTNDSIAHRILEKAEKACLITNSLSGKTHLETKIIRV